MTAVLRASLVKQLSALARDQATNPIYGAVRYPDDDATFDAIADVILAAVLRLPADKLYQLALEQDPALKVAQRWQDRVMARPLDEDEQARASKELGLHYNQIATRIRGEGKT